MPLTYSDKDHIKRQKEKDRERDNIQIKKLELDNLKSACNEFKLLINDKKYTGQKYILETILKSDKFQRDGLRYTVKSSDEYVRLGIALDARIELLKDILVMPNTFFDRLNQMLNEDKTNA